MRINITHDNAKNITLQCDMIVTDPPFDMTGAEFLECIANIDSEHLLLTTTLRQYTEIASKSDWVLSFDTVLDHAVPKKSMSVHHPNYVHSHCVYLKKPGAKSLFDRKRRARTDTYDGNGYFPTIIKSPRNQLSQFGHAKNVEALINMVGCFNVQSICDPFAGAGTTGFAAFELNIDCDLVELDESRYQQLKQLFSFLTRENS